MVLGWLKNRDSKSLETWVILVQGTITFVLFTCFVFLLVCSVLGFGGSPNQAINIFLPIISGWIGVVLGFFFSREIGKYFEERLHSVLENIDEKANKVQSASEKDREKIKEEFEQIINVKDRQIERLKGYLNRYRELRLRRLSRIKRRGSENGKE